MGSELVDLQVERLAAGHEAADQAHRGPLENAWCVVALLVAIVDLLTVLGQIPAVVVVFGPVELRVPLVPAGRGCGLTGVVVVAVEELPHVRSPILPGATTQGARFSSWQGWIGVLEHAVVLPVPPGEQRGPRRTTQRGGQEGVLKARAAIAEQPGDLRQIPTSGLRAGQVVCHHDDDVRLPPAGVRGGVRSLRALRRRQAPAGCGKQPQRPPWLASSGKADIG